MMQTLYLRQIELLTPGMEGFSGALPFLCGQPFLAPADSSSNYKPQLLPPNERRRATRLTRLAFALGELFLHNHAAQDAHTWLSVFASSGGDYQIIDAICKDLALGNGISPTQFHNSVHNAVAGYWSIATGGQLASTSISAFQDTCAAGLFEAAGLAASSPAPVFLCLYDAPAPPLLAAPSTVTREFSAGLLLSATPSAEDLAQLQISCTPSANITHCQNADLETLRLTNPAARILPLAELIARRCSGTCVLPFNQQFLTIAVA